MSQPNNSAKLFQALKWRCIGPPRGGRVVAVAGHPTEAATFYFGACAGGVWKSDDAGTYWHNVSDGYFTSAAVGAIAIAPSDPNVIYIGTGETSIRGDVSPGDGVYKSTDGGQSWRNMGLTDTKHIGKIRIHPQNPDWVYVAALGHAFGPNEERGIFRSTDGGQTWQKILFRSQQAGAIDLALDSTNPRVLYATFWQAYRNFWSLSSGGPDSSLYKSTDGGDTWTELTGNEGLPKGIWGKSGVTISPAKPERVWAIIEAEKGGCYRSDNGGKTWELLTENRDLWARPWYYCHIFADPQDADTVYILNMSMWKSVDGGKTFAEMGTPHGDNHDLWIDPANPRRMIQGNDGGAVVTFNGGESWSTIYNQLTGQFYHVAVDNQYPYRVYGTQQDNSSISVPSATEKGAILWHDCYPAGTGESGHIAVHPNDPNIVYVGAVGSSPGGGGALQRYDHRTKQIRLVTVWPEIYYGQHPKELKYRFAWTFPIVFSPHNANVLYTTGNHIFRTSNEGQSWEVISPDLTYADEATLQASGGPITLDTSGAEHYGTVFALVESPHEAGVLWAGSDDGLLHLSRDGGQNWQNVTPPDLEKFTLIATIEPSPHDPATVYVAATRYKLDDYRPYLYKTSDYGQSWQKISNTFPQNEFTRVIREDPVRQGLLLVGTETGVFVSLDDGASWQSLRQNLPVAPVYDLLVKNNDLVVATHGRAFWILDDITPLRQLTDTVRQAAVHLFQSPDTVRFKLSIWVGAFTGPGKNYMLNLGQGLTFVEDKTPEGVKIRKVLDGGENPPPGVIITYLLPEPPPETVTLTFLDAQGQVIKSFTNQKPENEADPAAKEPRLSANAGLNRFVWNMRYPDAVKVEPEDHFTKEGYVGPVAAPGSYQVRLTVGEATLDQTFNIVKDPRLATTQADFDAQFGLGLILRDKVSETHQAINQLRRVKEQIAGWSKRLKAANKPSFAELVDAAAAVTEKLNGIEEMLITTNVTAESDRLRLPAKLNAKLVSLVSVVSAADTAPTQQTVDVFDYLSAQIDAQLARLQAVLETDVEAFNALLKEVDVPGVLV